MEHSVQVEKLSLEDQPGRPSSSMTPAQTVPTPGTQPTAQPGEAVSTSMVATVSPPKSPLDLAKEELIQEILRKLEQDNLESLEGIRLMAEVRAANSIDSLCVLYNRLAGIERQREQARVQKGSARGSGCGGLDTGYRARVCARTTTKPGCRGCRV